jgi:hypothetical protein
MAGSQNVAEPRRYTLDWFVVTVAAILALLSAKPYAGGWNDGSRLATVESLVDRHTLAIDDSTFVKVPGPGKDSVNPYGPSTEPSAQTGTKDKLLIGGHFYSDKSPVPAILLGGWYQFFQWTIGLVARQNPGRYCYLLTLCSSGLAYVAAVWSVFWLSRRAGLSAGLCLSIAASFGLGTLALTYAQYVNNHIFQLGTTSLLMVGLVVLADQSSSLARPSRILLASLGALAGLCYSIDLGSGPVLLTCAAALAIFRCRDWLGVASFLAGVTPWLVLHHVVNYAVGGTFKPANAVPEYFHWTGCPFTQENMTGGWHHHSFGHFLVYALALLEGKKGFLGHNLPLFLCLPAVFVLWPRRGRHFPEVLFAFASCGGVWLMYAAASTNYSGSCCSIRWFVPLLAPGYFILIQLLRRDSRYWPAFWLLSGGGMVMGSLMWWNGPWYGHMVPCYWPIQGSALLAALLVGVRRPDVLRAPWWKRMAAFAEKA